MMKKMVLLIGLLTMLVFPVFSNIYTTKYIYLRSTESGKVKKKLRSVEIFPMEVILDMKQVLIDFKEPLSKVNILITSESTGEEIISTYIVVENASSYVVDLNNCENGNYVIEFILPDNVFWGSFAIEE